MIGALTIVVTSAGCLHHKELREITKLPGIQVHVSPEAMQLTEA